MKIYSAPIALILITLSVFPSLAQSNIQFGISMGTVMPMGEFKATDRQSNQSGYATSGFTLNLDGDYYLNDRIAVTGRFNLGKAGIDATALSASLDQQLADYIIEDETRYDIGSWNWNTVAVGFKVNVPLFKNQVFVEAGLFPGISFPVVPDMNMTINDKENSQYIISQSVKETKTAFSAMADLGLRFKINKQMQMSLRSTYMNTKIDFEHVSYIKKWEGSELEDINKIQLKVPVSTLNFTVGLIYFL